MKRDQFKSQFDPNDEVRHLRAENERLIATLNARKQTSGQISEAMTDVIAGVKIAKPPVIQYDSAKASSLVQSPVTHVIQATDWHIGQTTDATQVEEFGEFNYLTAQRRVGTFGTAVINKTKLMRNAYKCDDAVVLGTADWCSGSIHDELIRTEEFGPPMQAVKAGFLLGAFLVGLAPHFKTVRAEILTTGNHDRITRKPQCEDGGINSWGYIVASIAQQYVSAVPNIKFKMHTSLSAVVQIENLRYLIMHGDGIIGTFGIPFYGIERRKQREAMARMNMPDATHFDSIVLGHFHTALNHEHWIVGGSLTGTTAFDHKCGRHSRAHQTSWFVHPKHGAFDWSRWWLS